MTHYYTVQIEYIVPNEAGNITKQKIAQIEFKDIEGWNNVKGFQHNIWQHGFRLETSPGVAWELVSPLRINTVRVFKQEKKYSL